MSWHSSSLPLPQVIDGNAENDVYDGCAHDDDGGDDDDDGNGDDVKD